MNISCDMAMDLIALYCDGVASEDSKKAVREHLAGCPVCAGAYAAYKRSREQKKRPAPKTPEEKYAALARTMRHKQRASNLSVAAIVAASILLGVYSTYRMIVTDSEK